MRAKASFYPFLLVLCALAYLVVFGVEYLLDPLGRSPVLDGAENLAWAQRIGSNALPAEPLYRALLYPWLLSLSGKEGAALAQLSTLFGVFCHFLNACLVGLLAQRLWQDMRAAWLGGLLYAVYPVALYFSVQVLDITFATTLFLFSVVLFFRSHEACTRRGWGGWSCLCGVIGGLAVLARPNFLPAVVLLPMLPILALLLTRHFERRAVACSVLIAGGLLLCLIGQGLWNLRQSGEFRILPWQGAYNLYAANREGANGKFYKQRVSFDTVPAGMNTTRMESEALYLRGVSAEGGDLSAAEEGLDVGAMNSYWRAELFREVAADPVRWLGLMGKKVVYLFNDWEQYNNLTYAYHKERFTALRWNPLGWGVLCLGALAALFLSGDRLSMRVGIALALLCAAYAAGVLLFFVSARFRLPLAPLLCVCMGGLWTLSSARLRQVHWRRYVCLCVGLLGGSLLLYGDWFDARDDATFIQDELLLANASTRLGEDAAALGFAEAVLVRDESRQEARRIQVVSLFNLWLVEFGSDRKAELWHALGESLEELSDFDAASLFVGGVVAWREGDAVLAQARWAEAVRAYGSEAASSVEALALVAQAESVDEALNSRGLLTELLFSNE